MQQLGLSKKCGAWSQQLQAGACWSGSTLFSIQPTDCAAGVNYLIYICKFYTGI